MNVRSYRGLDNDTDHYLVMIKLGIKLWTKWKQVNKSVKARYNTETSDEEEKRKQYQDIVYQTLEVTPAKKRSIGRDIKRRADVEEIKECNPRSSR